MNIIQPAGLIFIGVIINVIGMLVAAQKPARFKYLPVVITVIGLVISGIGALWADGKQARTEQNLLNKSEEIARLNQELANSVIGGDSFCYLTVGNIDHVKNIGMFAVIHQGEHNLYDVHARIFDLDKSDQLKGKPTFAKLKQTNTNISIGNLVSPFRMLHQVTFGNGNTRRFNIFFSARNGPFKQVLRFKKIHGKWVHATKVLKKDKVIYEKVDDEFPRTAEGNVEW